MVTEKKVSVKRRKILKSFIVLTPCVKKEGHECLSIFFPPKGHNAIDKVLACHRGSRGLNPNWTKDFFNSKKITRAPFLTGTPAVCILSLPMAWSNPGKRWLAMREVKERNCGKNPRSAILETNTNIIAMYGREGKRSLVVADQVVGCGVALV